MNIANVVDEEKCVSCGLCKSICPVEAIELKYKKNKGLFVPFIRTDKCIDCGKCRKYCAAETEKSNSLLGPMTVGYLAHAKLANIREGATSGGVVNRVISYLLKENYVEAVILVKHDINSFMEASAKILTKAEADDLDNNPREYSSRYVLVPVLERIKEAFQRFSKIAIVGTPCQIKAINKVPHSNVELWKIGIACSGGMSYVATEEYKRVSGLSDSQMFYRGNGWPGQNTLICEDKRLDFNHQGSLFERMFSSQIFKNIGCRNCSDQFAEYADISFCDFWNSNELKTEKIGNSCVIVRNKKAEKIINELVENNEIKIVKQLGEEEIIASQKTVLRAKKGDLCEKRQYKIFCFIIDCIYNSKLYKFFNIKAYDKIAYFYFRLCRNSQLKMEDTNKNLNL